MDMFAQSYSSYFTHSYGSFELDLADKISSTANIADALKFCLTMQIILYHAMEYSAKVFCTLFFVLTYRKNCLFISSLDCSSSRARSRTKSIERRKKALFECNHDYTLSADDNRRNRLKNYFPSLLGLSART